MRCVPASSAASRRAPARCRTLGVRVVRPGSAIERVMKIPGVVLPAFICNLDHHLVNLPVYADGLIDAWDLLDLPLFEEKLREGWVTTEIPDGSTLSVHGLGRWQVTDGAWTSSPDALLAQVQAAITELNPRMENLHDCGGTTIETIDGIAISKLGIPEPAPVRVQEEHTGAPMPPVWCGRSLSVFVRQDDTLGLADLRVFEDGSFELGRLPEPRLLSRSELQAAIASGEIRSEAPVGSRLSIHGLGRCTVEVPGRTADIDHMLLETDDVVARLRHRPDSIARCRRAFEAYIAAPSRDTKAALRSAYEAVPMHSRAYVGDPETKDVPVRIALYGPQEIERWSHRIAARQAGTRLPELDVPLLEPPWVGDD